MARLVPLFRLLPEDAHAHFSDLPGARIEMRSNGRKTAAGSTTPDVARFGGQLEKPRVRSRKLRGRAREFAS